MMIHAEEDKWQAEVLFSPASALSAVMHCTARVKAETNDDALSGAQCVLDLFARGRKAFLRVLPEANKETDFDTKETKIEGFVRFSFSLEAGEWMVPEPTLDLPLTFAEARP
jgi:hypothetical protein